MEDLHMDDVFSENDKSGKTLSPLRVSGVLENLYFQFKPIKILYAISSHVGEWKKSFES
ncbi:hypothetical protein [Paenibacillus sp. AD87]|uniref:hypothetical protein n=1 Tax=Paenibacillus sp. AD87 TaxID=1528787 RepID=UPI0018D4A699|nr:hypothetical protein [Paenibacillus sp. AD87]